MNKVEEILTALNREGRLSAFEAVAIWSAINFAAGSDEFSQSYGTLAKKSLVSLMIDEDEQQRLDIERGD